MDLSTLQEIAKKCGSELTERTDGDATYYNIDDQFEIWPTDIPVLVRGIVSRPHPTNTQWQILELTYDPGGRDEPPSSDYIEVEMVDSLGQGVQKVLELIAIKNIEGHFVTAWEDKQENEMQDFYDWN